LCKNWHAVIPPLSSSEGEDTTDWDDVIANWKEFSRDATVESVGLQDSDALLVEFAVVGKSGALSWPREAAAEEGRKRVIAEEELQFRRLLQGQDSKGNILLKPTTPLVGINVDASDRSVRWYTVKILDVQVVDEDTDEEDVEEEDRVEVTDEPTTRKKVKVGFPNDHFELIDVASERLAIAGRMVSSRQRRDPEADRAHSPTNGSTNGGTSSKARSTTTNGRSSSNAAETNGENGQLCLFPGFGSCGLTSIAYLPLLRS